MDMATTTKKVIFDIDKSNFNRLPREKESE